jgi:diketogulonate reductase-like aldo/keto reductase
LETLVDEGRCKAIGLSDVSVEKVKEIFESARIKPAVVLPHPKPPAASRRTLISPRFLKTQ